MVSLIIWSLLLIVSLKYAILILRADNRGEGGILALLALLARPARTIGNVARQVAGARIGGAALLYGDGAITPAISVLSAVEGLKVDAPGLAPACPSDHARDSDRTVSGSTSRDRLHRRDMRSHHAGVVHRHWNPGPARRRAGAWNSRRIQSALRPQLLLQAPPQVALAVLGAAFLAVTGGEAMYADLGHFGRAPIRLAWFGIVLPGVVLNYLGQGALLLTDPQALENPFYRLAPGWFHYGLVAFATLATVIASQAIISGAFSLTQQAIQLGFLPVRRCCTPPASSADRFMCPS